MPAGGRVLIPKNAFGWPTLSGLVYERVGSFSFLFSLFSFLFSLFFFLFSNFYFPISIFYLQVAGGAPFGFWFI
jgi:hypothetical protein